jgi:uroporphyrinogen decarboxylase
LQHQIPDRIPTDFQAKRGLDSKLRRHLGVHSEEELLTALGCDMYFLSVRDISQNETCRTIYRGPRLTTSETQRICPFGITFNREAGDDKFGVDEAIRGPLENATTPAEILDYNWPDPKWFDCDALVEECEMNKDRYIVGGFWSGILGHSYRMIGFENFLLQSALNPELVKTLIDRMTEFYLELNERLFRALNGKMDVWFFGNDFGSQSGMLISPDQFDDLFSDNYRALTELAKSYDMSVMSHSCGSIRPLIARFIDIGIDIIDPVQTTAGNMQATELKSEFGDRIVFHGAIDTQSVLPHGTTDEVAEHVRETIKALGADGGYILSSCNSLQDDTPPENVVAMYDTAQKLGV